MPESSLFRKLSERARFQHHVFGARASHARAYRRRDPHLAMARGSEQASRRRFRADRSATRSGALCPQLDLSEDARYPILGALYHPPGAIVRHDAVAWGYAAAAARLGVDIQSDTEVPASSSQGGRATESKPIAARSTPGAFCRRSPAPAPGRRHGRLASADPHDPAAGLRVAAAQAVPRSDHRVGKPAHLCLAKCARRARHGRRDRSLPALRLALDPGIQGRS